MKKTHTIAAVIASVAVVTSGVLATSAIAESNSAKHVASAKSSKYIEPSGDHIADGEYLGYVRADGRDDETAAVDFVSRTDEAIENRRAELVVDAGLLAKVHVFGAVGQPFRITVKDGAVEQTNFDSYNVMRIDEMPEVETVLVPTLDFWGGVGEPTIAVAAPSVLNALAKATGKRVRELPLMHHELKKGA